MDWRKSTYSGGTNCVEVTGLWRTSSYSGYNGDCVQVAFRKSRHSTANGDCVEVGNGQAGCGMVHIRDSKNPDDGNLSFTRAEWAAFLGEIRSVTAG